MKIFHTFIILDLVIIEIAARTCPAGELEYKGTNSSEIICCKPYDGLCSEDTQISRCTVNHGTETCEPCPPGKTLSYTSSSFNRRQCYDIPHCKSEMQQPEVRSVNGTTCACNWSVGQVHEEPENPMFGGSYNCQPRTKQCKAGEEPLVLTDGCKPCDHGFFKKKPVGIYSIYAMCQAWKNCRILGLEERTPGSSTSDAECAETNPTTPSTEMTSSTSTSSKMTTMPDPTGTVTNNTTPGSPGPVTESLELWKIILIAVLPVLVIVTVIAISCWCCFKRRTAHRQHIHQNGVTFNSKTPENIHLLNEGQSMSPENSLHEPLQESEFMTLQTTISGSDTTSAQPPSNVLNGRRPENGASSSHSLQSSVAMKGAAVCLPVESPDNQETVEKVVFGIADEVGAVGTGRKQNFSKTSLDPGGGMSVMSQDDNDPIHQTVPKQGNTLFEETAQGNTSFGDPRQEGTVPKTAHPNPPFQRGMSTASEPLPSSPITPDTTKPHAFVRPLEQAHQDPVFGRQAVEHSDNSSSVVGVPNSVLHPLSDEVQQRQNIFLVGTPGQGQDQTNVATEPASGSQTSSVPSFNPPELVENDSLSLDLRRRNDGDGGAAR